jgi:glycosyltransferase involved in cell wall biosynthesis
VSELSILYVWDADYPWDVRTEKICQALTDAGQRVTIVARNKAWAPEREQLREGTVQRMQPWRRLGHRLDSLLGFPAFFSPRWFRLIRTAARDCNADLIIVRDLPLCPTAIAAGRRLSIPVMLDMAENYPAMMRDRRKGNRSIAIDALVRNPRLVEMVERYCISRVDWILTVVEESSARLATIGGDRTRMTVVSNTPPKARAMQATPRDDVSLGEVTIVYLGLLEAARGIGEFIDAMKILHDEHRGAYRAIVVGGGRDEELFITRARAAGILDANITFLGRLSHANALDVVARADIGIIPHHATESWNTTIPNKLFDYMAAGLAVVSSDARPCVRIVEETRCGVTFSSGDTRSLVEAITRAAAPDALGRMAAAGRRAVLERYNWERDTEHLLGAIRGIVPARSKDLLVTDRAS